MHDAGERTLAPSAARRRRAREAGRVAQSRDLTAAVALLGALLLLELAAPALGRRGLDEVTSLLRAVEAPQAPQDAAAVALAGLGAALGLVLPLALLAWGLAAAGGMVQTAFLLRPAAIAPSWQRLSLVSGMRRLLSRRTAVRSLLALLKIAVPIGLVVRGGLLFASSGGGLEPRTLMSMPIAAAARRTGDAVLDLAIQAACAFVIIGLLDWLLERRELERELRMTHREAREEAKEQALRPEVRRRLRSRRERLARRAGEPPIGREEDGS